MSSIHDDVIKWEPSSRHWPFVKEIHKSPVDSLATRNYDIFFYLPGYTVEQTIETPVIWDAIAFIMTSL